MLAKLRLGGRDAQVLDHRFDLAFDGPLSISTAANSAAPAAVRCRFTNYASTGERCCVRTAANSNCCHWPGRHCIGLSARSCNWKHTLAAVETIIKELIIWQVRPCLVPAHPGLEKHDCYVSPFSDSRYLDHDVGGLRDTDTATATHANRRSS